MISGTAMLHLRFLFGLLLVVSLLAPACDDGTATPTPSADASADTSTDAAADVAVGPDVVELPGLGIDYEASASGTTPRYEPTGTDWLAMGWPNDRYLTSEGRPDLKTRFPNPNSLELLQIYLDYGQEVLDGWGLNGTIFFELDGLINEPSLPDAETSMNDPKALVQMVNVTAGSPRYGEQMPLLFKWYQDGTDKFWEPRTLAMRPVFGFPLAEGETYCAMLTRGLRDANGRYFGVSEAFTQALQSDEPTLAAFKAWLENDSELAAQDIAVATCLTGQNATTELRQVLSFLETQPLAQMTDIEYLGSAAVHHEFRGHYVAPNFQAGEKPYDEDGDLRFDANGDPVIQLQEEIRFLLMVPKPGAGAFPMPAEGYPVVTYAHGTGGDYDTCKTSVGPPLVAEGVAVICIDQPLHGERGPNGAAGPELNETELVIYSFNFQNARAGRMSFRQSAIDTMSLTRMIAGGNFDLDPSEVTGTPYEDTGIAFDPANILFFGHSHGGLSGALAFGVDPELSAGVLSGAGGVMIETILRREDPPISALAKAALGISDANFDSFHPALTVIQMLVDATDPVNYSPYWFNPKDGGTAKHMFVTEGTADHATPGVGTEAMCAAAKIPIANPVQQDSVPHQLLGLNGRDLPLQGNIKTSQGDRTAALRQYLDGDHWVGLDHPDAVSLWTSYFRTIRKGFPVTIGN